MSQTNATAYSKILPAIILVGIIIFVVGGFAIYESRQLAALTDKIHNHPLAVSNAVRKIQANINSMHRSMKDVVIADTPEELKDAIDRVDADELESFKAFDLIAERFLGNQKYVESARRDFKNWKTIRDSVIALKKQGLQKEAAQITKTKGPRHIDIMNDGQDGQSGLNYLLQFAENKAREFRELSNQSERRTTLQITFIFVLCFILALAASAFFRRGLVAAAALQESEERFRVIFEQAAVGVAQIETKTGRFTRINKRYCDIFGYAEKDMTATTFMKITHPDDLQTDLDNMEKLKAGELREFTMEKRYYSKDGSIVWVNLSVSPMWTVGQEPNYHIAVVEDITGRKQAEAELQKHHDRLETLVEERTRELTRSNEQLRKEIEERKRAEKTARLNESRLAVLLKLSEMREGTVKEIADFVLEEGVRLTQSRIGFIGFMNDEETEMTLHAWSTSVMEDCGIPDKTIQYPIERAGLWAEAVRQRKPIITNDSSAPNPYKRGVPEGHVPLLRLLVFPVVDRSRVVAVVAVANKAADYDDQDLRQLKLLMESMWEITKYQDAQKESRRLREELSLLTRVATAGELATSLAHELNQPLAAIMSNAQTLQRLLKSDTPDMGEVRDTLVDIVDDNRRASGVIRSLRNFLKKKNIKKRPVNINTIIQETLPLVNNDLASNTVSLTLNLHDDMPLVAGDRIQLQQVVLNLIINAVEAMRGVGPDSRQLVLQTRCDDDPSAVTVAFQDSGTGIDSGKLNEVFDPFFTTKQDGMGMGLSISRTIIEAHAGRIWAMQNPDGGAIFSFSVPVHKR